MNETDATVSFQTEEGVRSVGLEMPRPAAVAMAHLILGAAGGDLPSVSAAL